MSDLSISSAAALQVLSGGFAAAVLWLLVLDDRGRLRGRTAPRGVPRLPTAGLLALVGSLAVAAADPLLAVDVFVGVAVLLVAGVLVGRGRSRAAAAGRSRAVVAACDALVAELRSGQPPGYALQRVAEEWPELAGAASAARMGADVPTALRHLSGRPGGTPLAELAAAWQVSTRAGAGLADVLDRMGASLREQEEIARETAAAVAPARATAHLLAVLPLAGLALGTALGGDPLHVLFATPVGSVLLVLGAVLAIAGVLWVERLVAGISD